MSNRSVSKLAHHSAPVWAAAAAVVLLSTLGARSEDDLGNKITCEVNRVFQERQSAVVRVEALDHHGRLTGTGFFTDPSGTIYTLSYIVANAQEVMIVRGDEKIPAKVLVADPRSGIALLKADISSPFIPLGNSRKLALSSPVLTIGYTPGFSDTPSFGIVGGFDRKFLGKYFTTTHIRANLPVQAGFGGAPLLNLNGEVVGIIIAGVGGGASCYAVPIEAAEKIRMDYARYGEPRHGWLGVKAEEQDVKVDGSNVRISEVGSDTPAALAGLKPGDVLLQIGAVKITEPEDIIDASYFLTAGDKVAVEIVRDGQKKTIEVESARHPATGVPSSPNELVGQVPMFIFQ